MLEANYISLRKLAASCKLSSPSSCYESDSVGPLRGKRTKIKRRNGKGEDLRIGTIRIPTDVGQLG